MNIDLDQIRGLDKDKLEEQASKLSRKIVLNFNPSDAFELSKLQYKLTLLDIFDKKKEIETAEMDKKVDLESKLVRLYEDAEIAENIVEMYKKSNKNINNDEIIK